jgi:hypothetical protein
LCDTTGIDDETLAKLLNIPHVRVVAIAGVAKLCSVQNRFRDNSKLVFLGKPAYFDREERDACFELHDQFYAFQFAVKALVVPSLTFDKL